MRRHAGILLAIVLALAGAAGCGSDQCDEGELAEALAEAEAGDEIEVGACEIAGNFKVPAGVSVRGEGAGSTVLRGVSSGPVVSLAAGTGVTKLSGLTVESSGVAGVVGTGAGSFELSGVVVSAPSGVGIGFAGATSVSLRSTSARGAGSGAAASLDADDYGILLVEVASATLQDVVASAFASSGALFVSSQVVWTGGGAPDNGVYGIWVHGGAVDLRTVDVSRTWGQVALPAGAFFAGDADVKTQDVVVATSSGFGLIHTDATAAHTDLSVDACSNVGVWAQRSESFSLLGSASLLSNNLFANFVAIESSGIVLEDATSSGSRLAKTIVGEVGSADVGDGIQLVGTTDASLQRLVLDGNERVGLLVDLGGGSAAGISIADVAVTGGGQALGAIMQNGDVPAAWDSAIARQGATAANDAAFAMAGDDLVPFGILGPNTIPVVDAIAAKGILGPNTSEGAE